MTKPFNLRLLVVPLCLGVFLWSSNLRAQPLSYEAFVGLVSKQHPEAATSEKRLSAAREAQNRAGLLPDPEFTIGRDRVAVPGAYQRKETDEMSVGQKPKESAEWQVGLSQSFPWPGTLSAEERAASVQVEAAESDAAISDAQRRFAAAELYLRMVSVSKIIEVQKVTLAVVEGVRDFVHAKFKQGAGSHMEYLQAHSEAGVMRANIAALETDLKNLKRHALVQLDDPTLSTPDKLDIELEWPKPVSPPARPTDLVRQALAQNKEVRIARNAASYRRSLPSFTASGMLMEEDDGMRMYAAMIGVRVPLYSIGQRRSLERDDTLAQEQIASELIWHDKQKALALAQAQDRIAQIEASVQTLRSEVIPPVQEHIGAATAQFSQGKADIGTIVDGRRMLLTLQMTEITTSEALALARLSLQKIEVGLLEMALDQEVPQLAGVIGGGMAMPGTGGAMPAMPRQMPTTPRTKTKSPSRAPTMEDETPQSRSSGMGM